MLLADHSIDTSRLAALLREEFGTNVEPTFVPIGGDSWNYHAGPWWISVRRDRQGHAPASYEAACQLRDAGHDFVLAPARGRSGRVVLPLGDRPVVVSPFVSGRTQFPSGFPADQREPLLHAVEALHHATVRGAVPRETFDLFFDAELDVAVTRAEAGAPASGPLGKDVSELIRRNRQRIDRWRDEIRVCRDSGRRDPGPFVLTHGESAPPNVMITTGGALLLLDWGDLLWAPPERDTRGLLEVGVRVAGRRDLERFYELRWILGEVAEYAFRLTSEHAGSVEDWEKRRELARYLD